ncbi:hypothetical protein NW755_013019 [Fusarium falciforme]|uniref:Peptidase M43 pregnancy-associated plasma-A domain-containing protein n=1 Tax=Fusarium falciforme TaxID=195108 RepID=A0A9W8UVY9_9HYPO|nr:hypothetical protein NW755_013019 [Fusarium falciforme]
MLSKLARLLVSTIITVSLSHHAWATPIVSDHSLTRVDETHSDGFSQPGANFQQPLTNPKSTFVANGLVLNVDFTYTFDKKPYPIKNLPVRLSYKHPLRGQMRINAVTDDNGKAKFQDPAWPTTGVAFDITVILDGRPAGSHYIIVGDDKDPDKPIQYVKNYLQQPPTSLTVNIDDATNPSLRLSEVLRNLAVNTPDTQNKYGAFGLGEDGRPMMRVGTKATRLVVAHEWGHFFTYLAQQEHYIYYGGGNADGHDSCADKPQDPQVAFGEGFASAYALIMEDAKDGILEDGSQNPTNYELYSCSKSQDMRTDEGRFTAALFDLWDSTNDNNGGDQARGAQGHEDSNSGFELTPQEILLDPIRNALAKKAPDNYILSPMAYWQNLEEVLTKKQGSDTKWKEKLEKAREIFKYNFADFV